MKVGDVGGEIKILAFSKLMEIKETGKKVSHSVSFILWVYLYEKLPEDNTNKFGFLKTVHVLRLKFRADI